MKEAHKTSPATGHSIVVITIDPQNANPGKDKTMVAIAVNNSRSPSKTSYLRLCNIIDNKMGDPDWTRMNMTFSHFKRGMSTKKDSFCVSRCGRNGKALGCVTFSKSYIPIIA